MAGGGGGEHLEEMKRKRNSPSKLRAGTMSCVSPMWAPDGASLGAQTLKNLPAMQNTQVPSLGWEDPLEEEMATHSSIFAWRIPWIEEPGRL